MTCLEATLFYEGDAMAGSDSYAPIPEDASDHDLVSRARTGDFAAFEVLVRRYRNDVFGLAFHFLRDRESAWDISQEVFLKAHRGLNRFRGDASFKTWLMRITANQCKDMLKKRRIQTVAFSEEFPEDRMPSRSQGPDDVVAAQELGEAIQKALDSLSPKHRTAFVLRELEGLSYADMARVMHCTQGTVMSRLHHARRNLKEQLLRMGIQGG